ERVRPALRHAPHNRSRCLLSYLSARPLFLLPPRPPRASTLFPYTTLFRSLAGITGAVELLQDHFETMSPAERRRFLGNIASDSRSEEHTSELQSHLNLVCRLLLEKKNTAAAAKRSRTAIGSPRRPTPPPTR